MYFVVFVRLTSANALGSSLHSVNKIIHHHYHRLPTASVNNGGDVLLGGSHGDHQSNAATACPDIEEHDENTCGYDDVVTILEQIVQFVRPFVSQIHRDHGLDHMIHMTPVQQGCISL